MRLIETSQSCAWCSAPKAVLADEDGDPICTGCFQRKGPTRETTSQAAERLGLDPITLLRAARDQRLSPKRGRLAAHAWNGVVRELHRE